MKVLIIEDETAAAKNIEAIIRSLLPDVTILDTLESVEESVEWFREREQPDIVFMDIRLADGDSFSIFEQVTVTAPVVFTTAYDKYALEAFKVNSIDYILKPIKESDIKRALLKLRSLTQVEISAYKIRTEKAARLRNERRRSFLVRYKDKIIPLKYEDTAFVYVSDERVRAYTFEGDVYPLDGTLESVAAQLPDNNFFRVNRQFIVSRKSVREISAWLGARLHLTLSVATPEKIFISKARVPEFKEWIAL